MTMKSFAKEYKGSSFGEGDPKGPQKLKLSITGKKKQFLTFKIGNDLLDKAKIAPGDIVDVLYDGKTGKGQIIKSNEGWKISKPQKNHSAIQFVFKDGMPKPKQLVELQWQAQKHKIEFQIKPDQLEAEGE